MPEPSIERIEVRASDWAFSMNAYIVRDPETGAAAIVDPGAEAERLIQAAGAEVRGIWVTHAHYDHVGAVQTARRLTRAPVVAHRAEAADIPGGVDFRVQHGADLTLGNLHVRVLHIPGHTPGHLAFLAGRHVIAGDILFPGGPGHTGSPDEFRDLVAGIEAHLLTLDPATIVHPGHGKSLSIKSAAAEYRVFKRRAGIEGLCGDVTWAGA